MRATKVDDLVPFITSSLFWNGLKQVSADSSLGSSLGEYSESTPQRSTIFSLR